MKEKLGKWLENKKVRVGLLFIICALQLAVFLFYGSKKSFLMCDELFTYGAANYRSGIMMEFELNVWQDEGILMDYATPGEDAFCYSIPYNNQKMDVHPPLYYYLIHTISSFHPNEFSYWTGVGLNLVLLLGCAVVLYFLTFELFHSKGCAFLVSAFFGVTYGALNTMLFVRMYMLFALILLLHLWVYARYWERPRIEKKGYLFLGLTLVAGALTQYYFLIAAFFLGAWYTMKLLIGKRLKETVCYLGTIAASAGVSLRIFSPMWDHIFHGTRGSQAQDAFFVFAGYARKLLGMFRIISDQMFGGYLWIVLGGIVILLILDIAFYKRLPLKELSQTFPVIFMAAGYFLLVTKIAPYIIDRYLMPIYPVVFLLAVGYSYWLVTDLWKKKGISIAVCAGVIALGLWPLRNGTIPEYGFAYVRDTRELLKQYADKKAVYIDREFYWWEYYNIVQLMKEQDAFYVISYAAIVQDEIDTALQAIGDDGEVIVYVGNSELDEEITEYIKNTVGAQEMELLAEHSRWTIYRGVR